MKRLGLLLLLWCGFWACASFASPKGYYLGWAEIAPIEGEIQVSFNPIDCNVCAFVVILPQEPGVPIGVFREATPGMNSQVEVSREMVKAHQAQRV